MAKRDQIKVYDIDDIDSLPRWARVAVQNRQQLSARRVTKLSLATIERHRQIINKMEREKFITPGKAIVLRQELKGQL